MIDMIRKATNGNFAPGPDRFSDQIADVLATDSCQTGDSQTGLLHSNTNPSFPRLRRIQFNPC